MLLLALTPLQAQTGSNNSYILSFEAGASFYRHSGTGDMGIPMGGFSFGRWIAPPLAVRFSADATLVPSYLQSGSTESSLFVMAGGELMWDLNATFFHVYNRNYGYPMPVYPLLGLGMVWRPEVTVGGVTDKSDYDFLAMLGLHAPFRIAPYWDLFLQYKCYFLPQGFDGSTGDNFLHSATIGVTHRWSDNPYGRQSLTGSRSQGEDWFFGIGAGPNFSSFAFEKVGEGGMYGFTPEIMVGRNFTPFWGLRMELGGLTAHERYDTINDLPGEGYVYSNIHLDLLMNVSNSLNYARGRRLNLIPYIGAGLIWRYDDVMFDMQADAGLMLRYYVTTHSDIYADIRYTMIHPRMGGETGTATEGRPHGELTVGIPSITLGWLFNIGRSTTRYRP